MSINISYNKGIGEKNIKNYVLFSDEDFKIFGLKKLSISKITNQINNTINSNKSKKKDFITDESIAIHHWGMSWMKKNKLFLKKVFLQKAYPSD